MIISLLFHRVAYDHLMIVLTFLWARFTTYGGKLCRISPLGIAGVRRELLGRQGSNRYIRRSCLIHHLLCGIFRIDSCGSWDSACDIHEIVPLTSPIDLVLLLLTWLFTASILRQELSLLNWLVSFSFLLILQLFIQITVILLWKLFWPFICNWLLTFVLHETDLLIILAGHAIINLTIGRIVSNRSGWTNIWRTMKMSSDLFTTRAILLNEAASWTLRSTPSMTRESWRLVRIIISSRTLLLLLVHRSLAEVMDDSSGVWALSIRGPCVSAHIWLLLLSCGKVWIRGLLCRLLVCRCGAWRLYYVIWVVDGEALDVVIDDAWIAKIANINHHRRIQVHCGKAVNGIFGNRLLGYDIVRLDLVMVLFLLCEWLAFRCLFRG